MGNVVDPRVALELVQRARLTQGLGNITGGQSPIQAQVQNPVQSSQAPVQAPTQAPPSARDTALSDYRQALQTPAPSFSDYHPSVGRRIVSALLGGIAGAHDPKSGAAVAEEELNKPYNKELTDYQRKLAQKKEAFDTEEGVTEGEAKLEEEAEKSKAEVARAGAEDSLRKVEEFGISPEGIKTKLDLAKVEHPGAAGKSGQLYDLTLDNGEELKGVSTGPGGTFTDPKTNTTIGPDAIKSLKKVGTESSTAPKPEREGEAGYIDKLEQKLGRPLTDKEQLDAHKQYDTAGRKPEDSGAADFRREIQMQSARSVANRPYQRNLDLATNQLNRINRSVDMIDKGSPESLALSIPEILTGLVSGQGTGVRITQAEMNSMIKARGWGESIEAFTNNIRGLGNLSNKQKTDLHGLLEDVQKKVGIRQRDIADLMDKIDLSDNPKDIGKAQIDYRKKLTEGDKSTKSTSEELRKKYNY